MPEYLKKFEFQKDQWIKQMKAPSKIFISNNRPGVFPRTWHKDKLGENDLEMHGLKERFLDGHDNEPRLKERLELPEIMFTNPFKEPEAPDLSQLEYEYLIPEVSKFEDRYGL